MGLTDVTLGYYSKGVELGPLQGAIDTYTAQVAAHYGVVCQVSLEQPMACGMATCQSCVIKYRPHEAPPETDWKYKLTCTEGPVFDSRDILW